MECTYKISAFLFIRRNFMKMLSQEEVVRDQIKNSFCHDNGIRLIRIAFTDFHNISDILDDYFGLVNNANIHSKGAKMQNEQNRKS